MSAAQQKAYVQEMTEMRAQIKKKIGEVSRQREEFVAGKRKQIAIDPGATTLGDAIGAAVRQQLRKSGFDLSR